MPRPQTPQHVSALQGEFKIREPFGLFIREDVQPVVILSDLSGATVADRGFPRDAWGAIPVGAGGAGTNVQCVAVGVGLRGKLYKLTRALICKPGTGLVGINASNGDAIAGLSDVATKGYVDQRVSDETPDMQIASETPLTAAIDGTEVGQVRFSGAETIQVPLSVVLGFGGFLNIVNLTANEELRVTYFWTEYLLEDR